MGRILIILKKKKTTELHLPLLVEAIFNNIQTYKRSKGSIFTRPLVLWSIESDPLDRVVMGTTVSFYHFTTLSVVGSSPTLGM